MLFFSSAKRIRTFLLLFSFSLHVEKRRKNEFSQFCFSLFFNSKKPKTKLVQIKKAVELNRERNLASIETLKNYLISLIDAENFDVSFSTRKKGKKNFFFFKSIFFRREIFQNARSAVGDQIVAKIFTRKKNFSLFDVKNRNFSFVCCSLFLSSFVKFALYVKTTSFSLRDSIKVFLIRIERNTSLSPTNVRTKLERRFPSENLRSPKRTNRFQIKIRIKNALLRLKPSVFSLS